MCGIAGIVDFSGQHVSESALVGMSDAMAHRGPDGEGQWYSSDSTVGLAHRRLAIVDLTPDAAQPMTEESGTVHLTFNGEIYNHLEIRAELSSLGHQFKTDHSDTEVLIHGYKQWGLRGLVNKLVGMFAFAIWDEERRVLSLGRDRIGIKPVYFCHRGNRFRFASEIKAILTDPAVPRAVNPTGLRHYLSFMVTPAPLTLFKDIWKLPAGHIMEVNKDGTMTAERYWDAVPGKSALSGDFLDQSSTVSEENLCTEITTRFENAVKRRMMSDVPFGVFLSRPVTYWHGLATYNVGAVNLACSTARSKPTGKCGVGS